MKTKHLSLILLPVLAGLAIAGMTPPPPAAPVAPEGPADFPSPGQQIVLQGVFDTYAEDGNRFVHVRDAILSFRRLPAP